MPIRVCCKFLELLLGWAAVLIALEPVVSSARLHSYLDLSHELGNFKMFTPFSRFEQLRVTYFFLYNLVVAILYPFHHGSLVARFENHHSE
jgi:hypothetical protein